MRFLFTTQPGTGHLHPLLPVARGLRDRGHDVAFAVSGPFAPAVTGAGFVAHAVGRPWLTTEMPRHFPQIADIPPGPERYAWARRAIFAHDTALDVVPGIIDLAGHWRPDIVVREAAEYGGYLAAEVLGIPHAVVRTDSGSSCYAERSHVAAELDEVRVRWGLAPDPAGDAPFRHLQLSFAPPGLDEDPVGPTCVQLQPAPTDLVGGAPPWFAALLDGGSDPIVYATLGTVYNDAGLLATIADAVAGEPVQLVLTTACRPVTGVRPPNVHVASWIPQDAVLPHCAAVVTHGGYGTVGAALGHGVPMVFLPISADQPLNARRLTAAGVGVTVEGADRSAPSIRAALRAVLDEPSHRATARRLAAEAHRRPPMDHGLDVLEGLAGR